MQAYDSWILRVATLATLLIGLVPDTAQSFGGICGRRDGCGNPNMDFRIPTEPREVLAPPPPSPIEQARSVNAEGLNLLNRGDFEAALRKFEQALQFNPNDPDVQHSIRVTKSFIANAQALQALNIESFDVAVRLLEQAVSLNPGNATMASNLAIARDRAASAATYGRIADTLRAAQSTTSAVDLRTPVGSGGLEVMTASTQPQTALPSGRRHDDTRQIQAIVQGIRAIQVPPPISEDRIQIQLGQLAPEDATSKNVLLGAEAGVVVLKTLSKVRNASVPIDLILLTGQTGVALMDGAIVYAVRQNHQYERALAFLKNKETRQQFTDALQRLRAKRPLDPNTNIAIAQAASALLDPRLGYSSTELVWDGLLSPEARNAAITRAAIEFASKGVGQVAGDLIRIEMLHRDRVAKKAFETLASAKALMGGTRDAAQREALQEAVNRANKVIAGAYRATSPHGAPHGFVTELFAKEQFERGRSASR